MEYNKIDKLVKLIKKEQFKAALPMINQNPALASSLVFIGLAGYPIYKYYALLLKHERGYGTKEEEHKKFARALCNALEILSHNSISNEYQLKQLNMMFLMNYALIGGWTDIVKEVIDNGYSSEEGKEIYKDYTKTPEIQELWDKW